MKAEILDRPLQDSKLRAIALEKIKAAAEADRGLVTSVAMGPHERAQSQYPNPPPPPPPRS